MKIPSLVLFLLCYPYLLTGCDHPSKGAHLADAPVLAAVPEIAWFEGSVEQALATATRENKLLLIYWGAKWCPYCQALRNTVFTRPDFIAKTTLFVSVYLDGDLPGAQAWGETFKVSGYPTLLVLRPDRSELARMSGGMDLSLYAALLDDALQDSRPIQDVLVHAGTPEDCHRLSYYGWESAALQDMDATELATALTAAAARCQGAEQVRLQIDALNFALQAHADRSDLIGRVRTLYDLLDHPQAVRPAIDLIAGLDDSLFGIVTQQGAAFTQTFRIRWVERMQETADDTHFGDADRLIVLASALDATKELTPDHTIPGPMQQAARRRIQQALALNRDRFKRNDLVNAAGIIDDELGDIDAARAMYLKELPNTRTPYYYMSHLAAIAEKQGNPQEALDWMAKAYGAAEGPDTRLRWGGSYLRGLIRLRPDDTAKIRSVGLQVAADASPANAPQTPTLHGRSRATLAKINQALEHWASTPQRRAVASELASRFLPLNPGTSDPVAG
jgi:protein disulfide-isomerase